MTFLKWLKDEAANPESEHDIALLCIPVEPQMDAFLTHTDVPLDLLISYFTVRELKYSQLAAIVNAWMDYIQLPDLNTMPRHRTQRVYEYLDLIRARIKEPEGAVCAVCGGNNSYADDCGFWYFTLGIVSKKETGLFAVCEKCFHLFDYVPGER